MLKLFLDKNKRTLTLTSYSMPNYLKLPRISFKAIGEYSKINSNNWRSARNKLYHAMCNGTRHQGFCRKSKKNYIHYVVDGGEQLTLARGIDGKKYCDCSL